MKKKILVVEDDKDIADLVKLVLETEDFVVDTVLDPEFAMEKARAWRPDAILLDLTMPKIDGWEVFKLLRKDKDLRTVPVAILTAKSEQFDEMVGLHVMNADAYITKPFGKQELINKTHELFSKKSK
jgi:two-component system response regulator VicR